MQLERIGEVFIQAVQNLDRVGWFEGNSQRQTHEVGLKAPNEWGLYDLGWKCLGMVSGLGLMRKLLPDNAWMKGITQNPEGPDSGEVPCFARG